jgi:hypothetical protein
MEPKGLLSRLEEPTTGTYLEQKEEHDNDKCL